MTRLRNLRSARWLLAVYVIFILYGSLFPFHFRIDLEMLGGNPVRLALGIPERSNRGILTIPDLASNIILGVPLGALLVAGSVAGSRLPGRLFRVALVAGVLASAVEIGQLFVPGRVGSVVDVAGQVAGSLLGALIAHVGLGSLGTSKDSPIVERLRRHPVLGALAVLVGLLAADAWYPYALTVDPSTVWGNIKQSTWNPIERPAAAPWHALIVERVLPYAVAGLLACSALASRGSIGAGAATIVLTTLFSGGLEIGKLFIQGRAFQMSHVVLAGVGSLLGVIARPGVAAAAESRDRRWLVVAGAGALLAYHQLEPFDFVASTAAIEAKISTIEWMPFAAYIAAEPPRALFDAGKKVCLGGILGGVLRATDRGAPVGWTVAIAAVLEIGQLFEHSHHTSSTDVLLLGAGGALGARLFTRYRDVLNSRPES